MKRILAALSALVILLCGCSSQEPMLSETPWDLTVEYGESGADCSAWGWNWAWRDGDRIAESNTEITEPRQRLSSIPYLNKGPANTMQLVFAQTPDRVQIRYWTADDGYAEPTAVEADGLTLPVPKDDRSYLYEVLASWQEHEDALCWGKGIYYFRWLPAGATGESSDLSLYRVLQLEPKDLFGVEVINQTLTARKICRNPSDVGKILDYLKGNLTTDFVQSQLPDTETEFVLRLAATNGSQLTLGYASDGDRAWILLGGIPYEASPLDLRSLWNSLETPAVYEEESQWESLRTEEQYPESEWRGTPVYGYLRSLGDGTVFDEVLWISDEAEPNGYRLEAGTPNQTLPLAADCQFWILQRHWSPCLQVERNQLQQWNTEAGFDVLYRLYVENGEITVICEQYLP